MPTPGVGHLLHKIKILQINNMHDLAIIGAGPAGYVAAERAGQKGLKVVLFDKKELGGVCLNEGCIPTKTLLYTAKLYDNAKDGKKYGLNTENVSYDLPAIMKRKNKIVKKLVGGVGMKMKANKVDVVKEMAIIEEKKADHIVITADGQKYECKNIMVATGSEAFVPPIKGMDKVDFMTNREILQINEIPKSLNIIGGGVIGMEFASFFNSMGAKVSVFEMMPDILPGIDAEICKMYREEMEKKGVDFYLNAKVVEVKPGEVIFEKDNKQDSVKGEKLLVSVGRKPVTEGFGLEKLGVELLKGGIKIDNTCRTNIPKVYAAGDVTGFSLLAHTASREGEVVVNNLLGRKDTMRYNAVPGVVYTNPEISGVGHTEETAKAKGIEYKIAQLPMAYAGRFIAENEGKNGLCKVLVGKKYEEIIGVHMIGNPGSEMIYGACIAIEMQMRLKDMEEIIFPHPTVSEIFKETVFSF
jgi:dihydrolipoamide dehydrogenase